VGKQIFEEAPNTGGHADEFETSLYLALRPDLVDMNKAVRELRSPSLSIEPGISSSMPDIWPYWSTHTQSGVMGDATLASKEKGVKLLEAASSGLTDIVKELKKRELPQRVDHH
jgi:creatinine amidohydrolase